MSIPQRNRNWAREIDKALSRAMRTVKTDLDREMLYQSAPDFVARARGINDDEVIAAMRDLCQHMYEFDRDNGGAPAPIFHFASSYIFSHVAAGLITEKEADDIMMYVNDNRRLFND